MRFIELFAGIGGFRYGLEQMGRLQQGVERPRRSRVIEGKGGKSQFDCVWANEWDKYASQIYRKQYGEICEQDIRTVDPSTIPKHDLICAGFPCQSFSIAGKRGGFEDTRGTLFFEIMRIARAKRTPYLLLENVKGLLSHDEGDTFQTILRTLDEFGYDVQWQVLNSKDFGVPQNRERVFIIGHLRGQPRPKVFPIGEADEVYTEPDGQVVHAIDSNYHKGWLDNQQRTMVLNQPKYGEYHTSDVADNMAGTGKSSQIKAVIGNSIRRLTPIECERLQGFPDNWTEGISDTQRYKCLGNAVTTNVIEAIGRQWINGL
ncbi:hypothetical protein LCGC14_0384920 [marine sediment metagenome]|uniref:DNA (cytosine-5-)-methyltransferase n=1 Tax=marine sediment metagenome TaxID=412755 RepID=A0A0F9T155_9ZZZZ